MGSAVKIIMNLKKFFSELGLTNGYTIILVVLIFLFVPFQFEIYYSGGHIVQYYGYGFILNPPNPNTKFYTTDILWSRVFIELIVVFLISYYLSNRRKENRISEVVYVNVLRDDNNLLYLQTNNLVIEKVNKKFIFNFTCLKVDISKNQKIITCFRVLPDDLEFQVLQERYIDIETNKIIEEHNDPLPFSQYKIGSPIHQCINFIVNNPKMFTLK